jgi:HemY protein
MHLFRNLLFWLLLALAGALLAQWLLLDPGYVLVRYLGTTIETTLVGAALLLGAGWLALWLATKALSWPVRAWRLRRERAARLALAEGLDALHHGRHAEAETLLAQAAAEPRLAAAARTAAARAASARGDRAAALGHLDALTGASPLARAIGLAELALAEGRVADALAALDAVGDDPRAPRLAQLRAEAHAAKRADEAAPATPALPAPDAPPAP